MDDKKYLELREDEKETLQMIISELKEIANSPDDPEERIEYLKQFIPETPIEVLSKDLDEIAKSVTSSDEVIDISDSSISIEPKFACKNGEPSDIISFSIVHDRTKLEECAPSSTKVIMSAEYGVSCRADRNPYVRPILYSQWLKQMMMRAHGFQAGIINYFPRSVGLGKLGCSWWWQKLMYRRLASILCGDYYTPYDTSEVNLESVIFMSTYEALPESVKRGIVVLDSMNVYGTDREMHAFIMSLSDVHPSYGKYLDNLEVKWPWSIFPVAGIAIETPSSKFNEAMKNAETKDKTVSTKHKRR